MAKTICKKAASVPFWDGYAPWYKCPLFCQEDISLSNQLIGEEDYLWMKVSLL